MKWFNDSTIEKERPGGWSRHMLVHSEHQADAAIETKTDAAGFHWRVQGLDEVTLDSGFCDDEERAIRQALESYEDGLPVPYSVAECATDAQVVGGAA